MAILQHNRTTRTFFPEASPPPYRAFLPIQGSVWSVTVLAFCLAITPVLSAGPADSRKALLRAYPSQLRSIEGNTLLWQDGTVMSYDDGRSRKSFDEMLEHPDLRDQMSLPYPVGAAATYRPEKNFDPGRIRYDSFFRKMYGATRQAVEKNLVVVRWLPSTVNLPVRVSRINGVDRQLRKVSDEIEKLPAPLQKYVRRISGSYLWRPIAGTNRLSLHSFGIAIDIDTRYSNYWQWDGPDRAGNYRYRNRIPRDIVDIFEKHGFIWGGAWYHYDTMHFEYRPELLNGSPEE
jgi:peptidoglycan LD-endopeptidase CwlK